MRCLEIIRSVMKGERYANEEFLYINVIMQQDEFEKKTAV